MRLERQWLSTIGFFYVSFPDSRFLSIAVANFLAVYTSHSAFFVESDFATAHAWTVHVWAVYAWAIHICFALPVARFPGGAWLRRDRIRAIVTAPTCASCRPSPSAFYSLLVVVFGCFYRVLDRFSVAPLCTINGEARSITVVESFCFSPVTPGTVGDGDILPDSNIIRVIVGIEVVPGILLLLFGFSEILGGPARQRLTRAGPPRAPSRFVQWDSSTGTVIARRMLRVMPPSRVWRRRECP